METASKTFDTVPEQLSKLEVDGNLFNLECYDSVSNILALETDWLNLEAVCKEDFSYFQSYHWCMEYYKQFADDLTDKHCPIPQVFVLRHKENPVMIWPLMRIQSRTGLKILTTASEPLGQYSNLLFDPDVFNQKIGNSVLELIIKRSKSDSVSFNNYPENSMIDKIIGLRGIKENSNLASSILDLGRYENWDDYFQTLSKSQRKSRRRDKNKLTQQGKLTYEVSDAGSEKYKALVLLALDLKKQWLIDTGRTPGILDDDCTRAMFTSLKQNLQDKKSGPIVQTLLLDKKPIAIELGMIESNRYYSYLGAIDLAYKDFSPGKVQMEMAQQWSMEQGIKNFDLLHDPSDYKSSWSNHTHQMISRNIPVTFKGYIYSKLWKTYIRPKLKSIYHFTGTKNRERLNKALSIFRK